MQSSTATLLIIGHPKATIIARQIFFEFRCAIVALSSISPSRPIVSKSIGSRNVARAKSIDARSGIPDFRNERGFPFPWPRFPRGARLSFEKARAGREKGRRRMLVWKRRRRVSRRVFDRYYLFIIACLPAPVTGRSIPRTGAYVRPRLGTQPRTESDPSFLPFSPTRPGVAALVRILGVQSGRRKVARIDRRESIPRARVHPTASRRTTLANFSNTNQKERSSAAKTRIRTSWRSPIDRSIDPSTNRPSKPAKPTALYFALEKYPVSRIEQKRLLSLGERPRSVIINDPIHRLGFASHWFVTRARVSPRVEKFFARCVPNISVRSSIVAR